MLDCPLPCLFQTPSLPGKLLGNKNCCCNFLASEMATNSFPCQCKAQPVSGAVPGESICSPRGAGMGDGRSRDSSLLVMVAQILWAFWATLSAVPIPCLWPYSEAVQGGGHFAVTHIHQAAAAVLGWKWHWWLESQLYSLQELKPQPAGLNSVYS